MVIQKNESINIILKISKNYNLMENIFKKQIKIFKQFNIFCKKGLELNSLNYIFFLSQSLGADYFKYKLKEKNSLIILIFNYFKELISLGFFKNIYVLNKENNFRKCKKIIFTWGHLIDFDSKGKFKDRYIHLKAAKNNILWVIFYVDPKLPRKIDENLIYFKLNRYKFFNIFAFLQNILFVLQKEKYSIKKSFLNFSSSSIVGYHLEDLFNSTIDLSEIKKLFLPYEAQIFQKKIINLVRSSNNKIHIIGFDHTAPQSMPLNLYYDEFSPDLLIVTSKNKANFNKKYLNWPSSKINVSSSFKFKKENKNKYSNKIFLPYKLTDINFYSSELSKFLDKRKINDFKKFSLINHPAKKDSYLHNKLIRIIKKKQNNIKIIKKLKNINSVIFLGQTTAVPLAIESGVDCYHIIKKPVYEIYNPLIWKGLFVEKVDKYLYRYFLKKKNVFIKLDNRNNTINL